jgi:creatinine amidohydrolase
MRPVLFLLSILSLMAQTPDTVFLEELTWTEVRTLLQAGSTTAILPTGGIEQNGPHIVLGKHNFRVKYAAERIARKLGNTLVAPVLPYAPQGPGNMKYPGTINLPEEHFKKVLEFGARSLKSHGFKDIVIICDSGSDRDALTALIRSLNAEWSNTDARVHFVPEYRQNGFDEWLLKQGETRDDIGTHGGILDTSLVMAVDPRLLRPNKLKDKGAFEGSVRGDPARASVKYGQKGLDLMVDTTVERVRELKVSSRRKN